MLLSGRLLSCSSMGACCSLFSVTVLSLIGPDLPSEQKPIFFHSRSCQPDYVRLEQPINVVGCCDAWQIPFMPCPSPVTDVPLCVHYGDSSPSAMQATLCGCMHVHVRLCAYVCVHVSAFCNVLVLSHCDLHYVGGRGRDKD